MNIEIVWQHYETYEAARDATGSVYLHEWHSKPFYWGKIHRSFFGGHMRRIGNLLASGRYNSGYRHWIEGCLRHGAKLYIGKISPAQLHLIDEVERQLIHRYGHVMNSRVAAPTSELSLSHSGDVPACVQCAEPC